MSANNREDAESLVSTNVTDSVAIPLSHAASFVGSDVLRRVVPEPLERRLATAAFNSAI
ncbi:hypothetical protein [Streptosporangium sp. NPDC002524]|uniref:hypothetical protein n=1 Tax=Streptosporangium sp. NPDC002524 TaxID=3154537 RepID=UPI0033259848